MLKRLCLAVVLPSVPIAAVVFAQITENPLGTPVENLGLSVEIRELVRLPETRGRFPPAEDVNPAGWARVQFVRDLPDGRRFVNDSRGLLYLLGAGNQPTVYANVAEAFPFAIYSRLESGFIGFTFHPDFARNGLFYTVHGERAAGNPAKLDFIPPGYTLKDVTHHNVITEWHAKNPAASTFEGTRRELLRVAQVVSNLTHPMGAVEFNPTSRPGSPDYGLLYTSGSDLGFSNGGGPNAANPGQTQRLDSVIGAILRFDPRSPSVTRGKKGLGDYTIPPVNKFEADGDANTLGEIYAYGFRNAHRLSWDLTDGTMFASDIGMNHIEEINIVREGGNYGWMKREGYFENGVSRGGVLNQLFPLAKDVLEGTRKDAFTYPVAIYDHDEGRAVSGGFAYHGRIAALRGKFVFGDVQRGRLFAADLAAMKKADDGIPLTVAPVEEIQLYVRDETGKRVYVTLPDLIAQKMGGPLPRADLHISQSRDGELLVTSRQDGTVRILVAEDLPDPKSISVPRLQGQVRIDGVLDELQWKKAASLTPFVQHDTMARARSGTEVRLWYDDAAMYLGWTCEDADIQATLTAHDSQFWDEEVVEFFVTPGALDRYFELQWNPLGSTFDAVIKNILRRDGYSERIDGDWSFTAPTMTHAVRVDGSVQDSTDTDTRWVVEARVPFADLRLAAPKAGEVWRANFYRFNRDHNQAVEQLSWSPTVWAGFHQPSRFGYLRFGK